MSNIKIINQEILRLKQLGEKVKDISDGNHTFADLYLQRMHMFSVICCCYPELSWKSKKHFDEANDPMFNGCFIVGINTPSGIATYHFKLEYWDEFPIKELEHAPKYDGYSPDDVLSRVKSLRK
ncbi:MAG: hypothetical protein IJZ79_05530 [Bacilli bacterium]|nr:hypothetical protein [Bacilli bacterium]